MGTEERIINTGAIMLWFFALSNANCRRSREFVEWLGVYKLIANLHEGNLFWGEKKCKISMLL